MEQREQDHAASPTRRQIAESLTEFRARIFSNIRPVDILNYYETTHILDSLECRVMI